MRLTRLLLTSAALLALAGAASAKPAFVAKAKAIDPNIKGCISCHGSANAGELMKSKGEPYAELGKFLKDQKAAKKAAEVDLNWIKDFKPKK